VVAELAHQSVHVASHVRFRVAVGRRIRLTRPAQVGGDDRVILRELAHQRTPHLARLTEAVQQQHRIALPGHQIVQSHAVRLSEPAIAQLYFLDLLRWRDRRVQHPRSCQREQQIPAIAHDPPVQDEDRSVMERSSLHE
jgi:hypothetical protein